MKKLMSVMLGLGFLVGSVSMFAQDTNTDSTKMEKKAKKAKHHKKAKKDSTATPATK